ncbi:hypothetical protein [Thalassoroseus pseudoceratinae]|uniref:hypothetical protein n=1 Tax=Thalassoroseus pseudoceratinae TaxID=2713176 RepID=UPI00141FF346|nr:hypothetical protein [Thalassoroseus pseudoceratinae]
MIESIPTAASKSKGEQTEMRYGKYIVFGAVCWPAILQAQLPIPHFGMAPRRCSVPLYDYRQLRTSLPNAATTFTAVLLEAPSEDAISDRSGTNLQNSPRLAQQVPRGPEIRFFQLAQPRIVVNHCAISRVAVSLWEDGRCVVNLLAEQSPPYIPLDILEPAMRFKRNRFVVTVRGYGFYPLRNDANDGILSELGQPEIFRVQQSFWVERGEAIGHRIDAQLGEVPVPFKSPSCGATTYFVAQNIPIHKLFDRVSRMEVELRVE